MKQIKKDFVWLIAATILAALWLAAWDSEYEIMNFQMPMLYNYFYNIFALIISVFATVKMSNYGKISAILSGLASFNSIMSLWSVISAGWLFLFDRSLFYLIYGRDWIGLGANESVSMLTFWFYNEIWMSASILLWGAAYITAKLNNKRFNKHRLLISLPRRL